MSLVAYGPHYELPSAELALWLEEQGSDCWWTVDGDPLLTGRVSFPCPGDVLAAELRLINRPLLLADKNNRPDASGQRVSAKDLDALVGYTTGPPGHEVPEKEAARWFFLAWKGHGQDWFLNEDRETAELIRREGLRQGV